MLGTFLAEHRGAIIERARRLTASRQAPIATPVELATGIPLFLTQITELLAREQQVAGAPPTTAGAAHGALGGTADQLGDGMLRAGLTVAQVVEGYGDVCQAITGEAAAAAVHIGADEYQTLNLCLDIATARAVTAFLAERDRAVARASSERLGVLAHELRNVLTTALLAFDRLRRGTVGLEGSTSALLQRSLRELSSLVNRSLSEVRLESRKQLREPVRVAQFIEEVEIGAALDARARGLELAVSSVDYALSVNADRQLLASALTNLLHNAIKFTRPGGRVSLTVASEPGQVFISVQDECGGLPAGDPERLFRPFESHGRDRSGLGLGLKISRDAVRASGGDLRVQDLPGKGCVFTIALPTSA